MKYSTILSIAFFTVLPSAAIAGAIVNRSNWSVEYVGSLSRNAEMKNPDAVAYNPGGAALFEQGIHAGISNQIVVKDYGYEFPWGPPSYANTLKYSSENTDLFLPGFFAAYRRDNWGIIADLVVPGGGGSLEYPDGIHTLQTWVSGVRTKPGGANYKIESSLMSAYISPSLGATWSALDNRLGLAVSGRWLTAWNEISVKNISGPPEFPEKLVDFRETAQGFGAILGVSYKVNSQWVLALRYDSNVPLEWEVEKSDINMPPSQLTAALRADKLKPKGTKYGHDLPALGALGVGYNPMEQLRLQASLNIYFQSLANWTGDEDKVDDGYEFGLGAEYDVMEELTLRAGYLHSLQGADKDDYFVENPAMDTWSVALGGEYRLMKMLGINLGVLRSQAFEDKMQEPVSKLFGIPGKEITFHKISWVFAAGLNFHM